MSAATLQGGPAPVGATVQAGALGSDLVLTGRLTARTSRSLHGRLRRLVRDGAREVRVDLRGVEQADAAAVAVLLVYARVLPPLGGRLVLTGASDAVQEAVGGTRLALAVA